MKLGTNRKLEIENAKNKGINTNK
uniref:MBF1 domain-containing protein n=1 Tax=Heterorhabditis bacteriophora TaxID=37862 RepID=A0A1I7X3B1_HETBA